MERKLCLIHANCQGEPLAELLRAHPRFSARYEVKHYVNYTREHVPEEELASCGLFIYQWLEGGKWGELGSERMLSKVGPRCRTLCLPNMLFKPYWPFWTSAGSMDYADAFLDSLMDRGLSKAEVVHIYVHTDVSRYWDLDKEYEAWLEMEREKERRWDVKPVDMILSLFRKQLVFTTINHPGRKLCLFTAEEVLKALGLDRLPAQTYQAVGEPFPDFVLPVHPQVAAHHGLSFLGDEPQYEMYGAKRSFIEYVNYYIDCRASGETDFISYIRARIQMEKDAGLE